MNRQAIPFEPDKIYHVYNHANGTEVLFKSDGNYKFFLDRLKSYILPIADIYAYCLMPNHFHIALKIKAEPELLAYFSSRNISLQNTEGISERVLQEFSNFFNSYTKAFNKMYKRRGRLFTASLRRKLIDNDIYFRRVIHYIHFNPVHHGFVDDPRDWKYSSFEVYFSTKPTSVNRQQVISLFNGIDGFNEYHKQKIDEDLALELEGE